MRINGKIRAERVRLIDDADNQVGIVSRMEALDKAREAGLDLVEVSPNSDPPVCRIMDYGKWLYQQKRKIRQSHKKHSGHIATLKEIRLRPETDKHDVEIKINHAREFLQKGHRVQFTVFFRGRQILHKEQGYSMLDQVVESLKDLGKIDRPSMMMGRRITLLLMPNK